MHIYMLVPVSSRLHGLSGYVLVPTFDDLARPRLFAPFQYGVNNLVPRVISQFNMASENEETPMNSLYICI